jgi:kinesin family member 11
MQDDLIPTPMGNPSAQAGMIPRTLFRLFHELETTTTTASKSHSSRSTMKNSVTSWPTISQLHLDRPNKWIEVPKTLLVGHEAASKYSMNQIKKGIFIQGLEEICVKDAADALAPYERQPTSSNCCHQIQRPFFTISLRIHYYCSHQ